MEINRHTHPEYRDRIEEINQRVLVDYPNLEPPTVMLDPELDRSAALASYSKNSVIFAPEFFEQLSPDDFALIYTHELSHLALGHLKERVEFNENYLDSFKHKLRSKLSIVGLISLENLMNPHDKAMRKIVTPQECEADHFAAYYAEPKHETAEHIFDKSFDRKRKPVDAHAEKNERIDLLLNPFSRIFKPSDLTFDGSCNITDITAQPVRSDGAHDLTLPPKPNTGRE